jgi:hypothetical protein
MAFEPLLQWLGGIEEKKMLATQALWTEELMHTIGKALIILPGVIVEDIIFGQPAQNAFRDRFTALRPPMRAESSFCIECSSFEFSRTGSGSPQDNVPTLRRDIESQAEIWRRSVPRIRGSSPVVFRSDPAQTPAYI